jgi:hypothetical protein
MKPVRKRSKVRSGPSAKTAYHPGIGAFAKRLFRDTAHAKSTIVVLALLMETLGVIAMLSAQLLK